MTLLDTLKGFLFPALSVIGFGDEVQLEKDIEADVAAPTEANLDASLTDAGKVVLDLDKHIPASVVNGFVAIGVSAVAFGVEHSAKAGGTLAGQIIMQLPVVDPGWKVTPEHSAALVQALSDIAGDFEATAPTV